VPKYFEYIEKEFNLYDNSVAKTIYFGGGTPSAVDPSYIERVIEISNPDDNCEITLEINPEHYKEYKYVNRFSIGIQSFDDNTLKNIGRTHSSSDAISTYYKAREKVSNISIDLMFALPKESRALLKYSLEKVKELDPEHISIYSLIWKEKTYFYHLYKMGKIDMIPEDEESESFEYIISYSVSIIFKPNLLANRSYHLKVFLTGIFANTADVPCFL
jgi:oxygen-independent coproporphyrinogen-3 oxidase